MLILSALLLTICLPAIYGLVYSFPDCSSAPLKGNVICDTTKDPATRTKGLISLFTVDELIANTVNLSPGVPRLGLPSYQWWSEALHGVAGSPGVSFTNSGNFSSATSFPQVITLGATFDDLLIKQIASVTSTEARAFSNAGRAGLDYFTPNINPFRDPRWGRGQETPGEDPLHISRYVFNLIDGLQGGIDPKPYFKVAADCKHYAAYDLEDWQGTTRTDFDAKVTLQELSEYYLPAFQSCVRDAKVASVMCSFNSVNGVPSCANSYLLQTLLRDFWRFNDDRWVVSDCDAVDNIISTHHFAPTYAQAVADALKAGTDVDCGTTYSDHLPEAYNKSLITRTDLEKALTRQYTSLTWLLRPRQCPAVDWSDVNKPDAQNLAYMAAIEGIVLLKNDGTLPLKKSIKKLAIIGPWANATTQMQANYNGAAPFLVSPLHGAVNAGYQATFIPGTTITGTSTTGFPAALTAAHAADAIIFAGGIDGSVENEALDRTTITWPGNQLDLISQLQSLGKPLIVVQFGGGQVDGTILKDNRTVNAMVWAGYPGQSGGTALFDILSGRTSPSGRLPLTQYPASFTTQVPMTDMNLRPSSTNPRRTYMWYTGAPVFEFGHGLHYTTFSLSWRNQPPTQYRISDLVVAAKKFKFMDIAPFDIFNVVIENTGGATSDYVALLFVNSTSGPTPYPRKRLISYSRIHKVKPGSASQAQLGVTLGSIARADSTGSLWLFNGTYQLTVDTIPALTHHFTLVGAPVQITEFPQVPS